MMRCYAMHGVGWAGVKGTGCMNDLVPSTSTGIRSLLISDGAPAYVSLAKKKKIKLLQCNHSKGIFSKWCRVHKRNWVRAHTGFDLLTATGEAVRSLMR